MEKPNNNKPVDVIQVNDSMSEKDMATAIEMMTPALINGQKPRNRAEKRKLRKKAGKKHRQMLIDTETTRIEPNDR